MKETGRIRRILKEDIAEVEFKSSSACSKCGKCSLGVSGDVFIEAVNKIGAKKGDKVEVEISSVVSSSFIVYILPVIFIVLGYFIGVQVHPLWGLKISMESLGIVFALIFLFISFVLLKLYDLFVSKIGKPCAEIIRKVGGE